MSDYHTSVLLTETIDGLHVNSSGVYVDCTLGGGGHTREILKRGGFVIGIDADNDALEENRRQFALIGQKGTTEKQGKYQISVYKKCILCHGNFRYISDIVRSLGFTSIDGIIFDLGVSSHQLNTPSRGFSYRFVDEPIDLRLDQSIGISARHVLQNSSEKELYEIISRYSEEERSFELSHAICRARKIKNLYTTGDVFSILSRVLRNKKEIIPTASRIFQALRIAVNDELENLKSGLLGAYTILGANKNCAVISFHSLEDRIVKQEFNKLIWRKIGKPTYSTEEEQLVNKKSRSATLRIAQKI